MVAEIIASVINVGFMKSKYLNRHNLIILLLFALVGATGCHSYIMDDAQMNLRKSYADGDLEKAARLLDRLGDEVYREKDEVLWGLENGMVHHFAGNYDSSSVFFSQAEQAIEDNYTKSLSRGLLSVLSNDNKLVYDGEPYEDIYLNAFKALNYIHLDNWEASIVETRRMSFKIEQLDIRLKGLADAFSQDTSTTGIDWTAGKVNIQSSALSHYLATVLYAKTGKEDDARIEFTKLERALLTQAELFYYPSFDTKQLGYLQEPETYNVMLAGFTGQAPIKSSADFRIFINDDYIKFSMPEMYLYPTQVSAIRVSGSETAPIYLDLIEEMDVVAREVYQTKLPIIQGRAIVRSLAKKGGLSLLEKRIEKKDETAGFIAGILSMIYQESSEKADLRGWQTMPGQAWMKAIWLPPGDHTLTIEYLDAEGSVLHREKRNASINPTKELTLIETLYPN